MEGYSVKEAASVLGVPKEKIWELLARGILAGTPGDGGSMRVHLQGGPGGRSIGSVERARADESTGRAPNGNGNSGEHGHAGFEASPFRELLTEFRNLTERYGQALLALGEARGEVASLRSRVDVLEARIDLRLPWSPPPIEWAQAEARHSEPTREAPASARGQEAFAATAAGSGTAPDSLGSIIEEPVSTVFEEEIGPASEPALGAEIGPASELAVEGEAAVEAKIAPEVEAAVEAKMAPEVEGQIAPELDLTAPIAEAPHFEPPELPQRAKAAAEPPVPGLEAAATAAESPSPIPEVAATAADSPAAQPRPRRRKRGARVAIEGFAEALSRAEDPTLSQLPGAQEVEGGQRDLRQGLVTDAAIAPELEVPEDTDPLGMTEAVAPAVPVELDALLADEALGGEAPEPQSREASSRRNEPTSAESALAEPIPADSALPEPIQAEQISVESTSVESIVAEPIPAEPTAAEPTAAEPTTAEPSFAEPSFAEPSFAEPAPAEPTLAEPTPAEPTSVESIVAEPPPAEPTSVESIVAEPTPIESTEIETTPVPAVESASEETSEPEAAPALEGASEPRGEPEEVPAIEAPRGFTSQPEEAADGEPTEGMLASGQPAAQTEETIEVPGAEAPADGSASGLGPEDGGGPPQPSPSSTDWDEPDWIAEEDLEWGSDGPGLGSPSQVQGAVALGENPEIGWAELPAIAGGQADDASLHPAPPQPTVPRDIDEDLPLEGPGTASIEGRTSAARVDAEEELMWLGDEFRPSTTPWSAPGRATTLPRQEAAPRRVSQAEDEALERLAVERGWDDEELHAIRSLLAQPAHSIGREPADAAASERAEAAQQGESSEQEQSAEQAESAEPDDEALDWEQSPAAFNPLRQPQAPSSSQGSLDLPGALELDEAMAAFEISTGTARSTRQAPTAASAADADESAEPATESEADQGPIGRSWSKEAHRDEPGPTGRGGAADPPSPEGSEPGDPSAGDADWLRGRRGPAANAYRRLRRLLP